MTGIVAMKGCRTCCAVVAALALAVAACSGDDELDRQGATDPVGTVDPPAMSPAISTPTAPSPSTTAATVTRSVDTTTTTTTTTATVAPTTTTEGPTSTTAPTVAETEVELGRSAEGRPITAIRRGTPGGTTVLVIGVIHGDEDAGTAIVEALRKLPVPAGIELWLVPSMNPDGQAAGTRQNANGVDLNRNFPTNWGPLGQPGDWQYAGIGPVSEPETKAMIALSEQVRPDLTLWYHQDLFRINPSTGVDGEIRRRYADLTGLPILEVSGGTYTGTASQWSRTIAAEGGIGFTVELGKKLSADGARQHAEAVLTVAGEL